MKTRNFLKLAALGGLFSIIFRKKASAVTISTAYTWSKTASQNVASSTTLTDLTSLIHPIAASASAIFQARVRFNLAGIISGYKFSVNGPASPTNVIWTAKVLNLQAGTMLTSASATAFGTAVAGALATTGDHEIEIAGTVENGANAGNISIQMAQNVSDSSNITANRGSSLIVWPLN